MSTKAYALITSLIFFIVAILHLLRLIGQWDLQMGNWHAPMWVSVVAVPVAAFLSYAGYRMFQAHQASLFR
jgi:hypothetical protein